MFLFWPPQTSVDMFCTNTITFSTQELTCARALVLDLVVAAGDGEVVGVAALKTPFRCAGDDLPTAVVLDAVHCLAVHLCDAASRAERRQLR